MPIVGGVTIRGLGDFFHETNDHNDPGFIASDEAGAGPFHKQRVLNADYSDTVRTTIYTGRPMRSLARIFQFLWAKLGQNLNQLDGFQGVFVLLWMRIQNLDDWKSWHILTACLVMIAKATLSEKDFI